MMTVLWIVAPLVLLIAGLYLYLKLKPGMVAGSLEKGPQRRGVYVTIGVEPRAWRALFVVEVVGLPGGRAAVRAGLARVAEETDLVIGLSQTLLKTAIGKPDAGDVPFSGSLDAARLERVRRAFADAGLELLRLELAIALPIDEKLDRMTRVCIDNAQRNQTSARCSVLDFYLDGLSGLGYWWATHYVGGSSRFDRSTDLVKNPATRLKLVPSFEGGLVFYRTLGELLGGDDRVEEL